MKGFSKSGNSKIGCAHIKFPIKFLIFFQQLLQGFGDLRVILNKAVIVASQSKKFSDVSDTLRLRKINHGLYFLGVGLYSFFTDNMTQKGDFFPQEVYLFMLEHESSKASRLKNFRTRLSCSFKELAWMITSSI